MPYQSLDQNVLRAIAEEFVSRDGTDYGEVELSMEHKLEQLLEQIRGGQVVIYYDDASESVNLMTSEQYQLMQANSGDG